MKKFLFLFLFASSAAFAHQPLSHTTVNAMNMIRSPQVQECLDQLDSRHTGSFYITPDLNSALPKKISFRDFEIF